MELKRVRRDRRAEAGQRPMTLQAAGLTVKPLLGIQLRSTGTAQGAEAVAFLLESRSPSRQQQAPDNQSLMLAPLI